MAQHSWFRYVQRSAVLAAVLLTIAPSPGCTNERLVTSSGRPLSDELQLLKEEESVNIEPRDGKPIPPLSSEPYVMTEEDIRESGATDLPALLRRILGLDVSQRAEPEITGSRIRAESQLVANRLLLVVDGRPIHIDTSDPPPWGNIPVALSDIKRIEVWNRSTSVGHGFSGYDAVINIRTKTSER
jgi:outer membrane receptor for Fe3+-dicitrate